MPMAVTTRIGPRRAGLRVLAFASAALLAGSAHGAIYETTITADTEEQLVDMEQRGDISSTSLEILLELLGEGVELNSADRDELYDLPGLTYTDVDAIIAYRTAKGRIDDPAELVGAGAITAAQLLEMAPFIRIDARGAVLPISGKALAIGAVTATDNVAPPLLLGARVKGPFDLSAGFLMESVRREVAPAQYDPLLDTLTTTGHPYQLMLPRAFLQWNQGKRRVVLGTFVMGFAERLVLDNTRRATPHGIYLTDEYRRPPDLSRTCKLSSPNPLEGACADGASNLYVTPDFTVRDAFRGIAASLEEVPIGTDGSFSAFGFLSYQSKSLYQYELYDRRNCSDPNNDADPACRAPKVFIADAQNPGSTKVVYSTLPYLYDELVGGAHFEVKPSYRYRLGVTAYGAAPFFHAQPMELDFQEWSRTPNGGPYGAIGMDGHVSFEDVNFFMELAHSFDHAVGGGGGSGAVVRSTFSPAHHEFELSVRYYDDKFGNPYGRPVSAPDEADGQRARNELGARLRWYFSPNKDWQVTAKGDFWVLPYSSPMEGPAGTANLYGLARADFNGWRLVQPALWVDLRNRNLASNAFGKCSSGTIVYTEGQPFTCNGDIYKVAGRLEFHLIPRFLDVITQGWFVWSSDLRYKDRFRNDVMLWGEVLSTPTERLHLRAKTRWLFQDISDNAYLEQSLWSFLEVEWMFGKGTSILGRYDAFLWLDRRASTLTRVPNPEHRFFVDLRYAF